MFDTYEKTSAAPEYTRVNIKQDDIVQTILSRIETKVNLSSLESIDGTVLDPLTYAPYEMTMHSKEIIFLGDFYQDPETLTKTQTGGGLSVNDVFGYPLLINSGEIEEMYEPDWDGDNNHLFYSGIVYPTGITTRTVVASGHLIFDLSWFAVSFRLTLFVLDADDVILQAEELDFFALDEVDTQTESLDITFSETLTLPANSKVYLGFAIIFPSVSGPVPTITWTFDPDSTVNFTENSITPESTANVYAIFETGAQISRVITDQEDSFRSSYFGRTNSEPYAYEENGCESFAAITNGFQIRGFPLIANTIGDNQVPGRPAHMSMQEYFDGLSSMFCLGLGVKQDGDNTYLEVESKDYFYTDDTVFNLSNIKNLTTRVDKRFFFNRIKIGYNEWRKEGTNGLDEFCTTQEYVTLNKNVSKTIDAVSTIIAAPYAIERQRRKQFIDTYTSDEEYDSKNFIIALNREEEEGTPVGLTIAEKDENFTNVANIISPETLYNLRYKPARLLRNWYKVIGTSLIKLNSTLKTLKFSFGEGNHKIESQGTGSCDPAQNDLVEAGENVEILIPGIDGLEPLFTGHVDEFDAPFSLSQYNELKELDVEGNPNYYKKIGYSTLESEYLYGYILDLRYKPVRGKASFTMARAYERSDECSHIYVVEGYVECDYVA
jgi:hypothetical protein